VEEGEGNPHVRGGCECVEEGKSRRSLDLPLNFAMNLNCPCKLALLKQINKTENSQFSFSCALVWIPSKADFKASGFLKGAFQEAGVWGRSGMMQKKKKEERKKRVCVCGRSRS
jgi:hypothetical protein